jgi:hypothetical protein
MTSYVNAVIWRKIVLQINSYMLSLKYHPDLKNKYNKLFIHCSKCGKLLKFNGYRFIYKPNNVKQWEYCSMLCMITDKKDTAYFPYFGCIH